MSLSIVVSAAAILLAPLIALQVSVYLEKRREKRKRRLGIFKTLMATRAARLSREHVQALNMIDVEFYGEKKVIRAWKAYLDHLAEPRDSPDVWSEKKDELFIDLLDTMATELGYDFDKTSIKNTSYFPEGHGRMEEDQRIIRRGLATIIQGDAPFPIKIAGEADEEKVEKWLSLLEKYFSNEDAIKVKIEEDGSSDE